MQRRITGGQVAVLTAVTLPVSLFTAYVAYLVMPAVALIVLPTVLRAMLGS